MLCFTAIPTTLQQPLLHYSSSSFAHHVRLRGEFLCLQTLDGHPLDRQLSLPVVLNTVILLIENVSGHAKVCHLNCVRLIQPRDRKGKVIFLLQIIIIKTEGCDVTSSICGMKQISWGLCNISVTHMQLRAARSLCTNFFWAKYSIPLATCSPKPIKSFTVGF